MKLPSTGEFRKVVQFERATKSTDLTGGQNESYDQWFTTRGALQLEKQDEDFQSGYDQLINKYKLFVFWRNEMEQGMDKDVRAIIESRSFKVTGFIMVDEKRKMYMLKLNEVR